MNKSPKRRWQEVSKEELDSAGGPPISQAEAKKRSQDRKLNRIFEGRRKAARKTLLVC